MPRLLLAFAAASVVAVVATATRAEDAPPSLVRRTVTANDLPAVLREAGYPVTDKSNVGWPVRSHKSKEKDHENELPTPSSMGLYATVSVTEDGGHILLASPPVRLGDRAIPHEKMVDLLQFNAGDSGAQVCLTPNGLLYMMRFVDNRAVVASALQLEIEEFFDLIRSSGDLLDPDRWTGPRPRTGRPDTELPPTAPKAPPEGMK